MSKIKLEDFHIGFKYEEQIMDPNRYLNQGMIWVEKTYDKNSPRLHKIQWRIRAGTIRHVQPKEQPKKKKLTWIEWILWRLYYERRQPKKKEEPNTPPNKGPCNTYADLLKEAADYHGMTIYEAARYVSSIRLQEKGLATPTEDTRKGKMLNTWMEKKRGENDNYKPK